MSPDEKRAAAAAPQWFHSFDFGDGVTAVGLRSVAELTAAAAHLPDVRGKSVLDVNTWDGWFAFECERRGAGRVAALDRYMWACDQPEHFRYWRECVARGERPRPYEEMPYFRPDDLPGRAGFDTAHRLLGSRVEAVVADFMLLSDDAAERLGRFDVVLFLGSLYHMSDPVGALRRVFRRTADGGTAVIETQAVVLPGLEGRPVCEFHGPNNTLNFDSSNYWSPNLTAVHELCLSAGFTAVDTVVGPPVPEPTAPTGYRATVHARR